MVNKRFLEREITELFSQFGVNVDLKNQDLINFSVNYFNENTEIFQEENLNNLITKYDCLINGHSIDNSIFSRVPELKKSGIEGKCSRCNNYI